LAENGNVIFKFSLNQTTGQTILAHIYIYMFMP